MRKAHVESDWFAVPLRGGGFGVGVVARSNPEGLLLSYFFGPKRDDVPSVDEVASLTPLDAVLVARVSHLGFTNHTWPVIGHSADWDRSRWPTPVFLRYEELTGRSFHVFYDDDDPGKLLREEQINLDAGEILPKDGLMGAGFAEKALATLLELAGRTPGTPEASASGRGQEDGAESSACVAHGRDPDENEMLKLNAVRADRHGAPRAPPTGALPT